MSERCERGRLNVCFLCRAGYAKATILTGGVFSMDGDLAPLVELGRLAADCDAWPMTDDAHGIGVVGNGRGSTFAGAVAADVRLQMGTLSKIAGDRDGCGRIKTKSLTKDGETVGDRTRRLITVLQVSAACDKSAIARHVDAAPLALKWPCRS